jgi:hypothetical protein
MSMSVSRSPSVLAIVGALVMIGCAIMLARVFTADPEVRTLSGAVTWVDTQQAQFDRDVHGGWTYPLQELPAPTDCVDAMLAASLVPGQLVSIYDGDGRLVARGNLGAALAPVRREGSGRDRDCRVSFIVEGVRNEGALTGEGGDHRDTFARHELDAADWNVEIALGI